MFKSIKSINPIVDGFHQLVDARKGITSQWSGPDNPQGYEAAGRRRPHLYKPEDFNYVYNEAGFRCDSFNEPTDFPVLFTGCSLTEGIGLPHTEVWAYKLLEKIREKTGLKIPYWNLALGGTGNDTIASTMVWFTRNVGVKPKLVCALFPAIHRREFCFESNEVKLWNSRSENVSQEMASFFADDSFARHQSLRSLQLVDALCASFGAKFVASTWTPSEHVLLKQAFPEHKVLRFPVPKVMNKHLRFQARDGVHPGPLAHSSMARTYWEAVEPLL